VKEDESCIRNFVLMNTKILWVYVMLYSEIFVKDPGEKQSIVSVCSLFVFGILLEKSPTVVSELVQAL